MTALPHSAPEPPRARPASELERWLVDLCAAPDFDARAREIGSRHELRSLTREDELIALLGLVERLRPPLCLEIGTFFAGTSRLLAEALERTGQGKLVTIDPYGGDRVPRIVAGWPAALQRRVEFRPVNSMTLFDAWEDAKQPKGGRAPLRLAFVDGNHRFEYALFDLVRSADFLAPGGAIVADNLDQEGPLQAAARFLGWNPAWGFFANGRVYDPLALGGDGVARALAADPARWGVLVAPRGIPLGGLAYKSYEKGVPNRVLRAVKLNAVGASGPGTVTLRLNYHAVPFDYHLTGTGTVQRVRVAAVSHRPGSAPVAEFEPAELVLPSAEYNVNREMELRFAPADGGPGYLLLDPLNPFTFE